MTPKFSQIIAATALALSGSASAGVTLVGTELITFDEAIGGVPFFNFDSSDPDLATDVVFSTTDPFGFNTSGPGPDQVFVDEPGLEGTTSLPVDLRVDFLQGAVGAIGFGFALISEGTATFTAFNQAGAPIGSQTVAGGSFDLGRGDGSESMFPENEVVVGLATGSTAVYGEFNFDVGGDGRYILDNFNFTPAGEDIISVVTGALPSDPILPGDIIIGADGVPEFNFEFPIDPAGLGGIFPIFIDPIIAIGYEYAFSSAVASVEIPAALANGDDTFRLIIPGVGDFVLVAGTPFDLTALNPLGFTEFTIDGIDTTELLDPNDPTAFVTGLTFVGGGTVTSTMIPITFDTDATPPTGNVPEPSTLALLALGAVGLCRRLGRPKQRSESN